MAQSDTILPDNMLHGFDSKSGTNKERVIRIIKSGLLPAKKVCLSISGYSMYPLLHPGSKVIISTHVNPDRILIGDIVVVTSQRGAGIMAHRVIFIWKRKGKPFLFLTKGDTNRAFDKVIVPNQIMGEIVAIQKDNRLVNVSKSSWRIAGFLIAVSSGTSGILHQWVDKCLPSSGKKRSRIGSWFSRLSFLAHRVLLYTIILPLH